MVLEITQYGDPVLRKKCRNIDEVDEAVVKLVDDMLKRWSQLMASAWLPLRWA